jgi:hypothetical protein
MIDYEWMNRTRMRDYVRKSMNYCTTHRIGYVNQHMAQMISLFPEHTDVIQSLIAEEFPNYSKRLQTLLMLQ